MTPDPEGDNPPDGSAPTAPTDQPSPFLPDTDEPSLVGIEEWLSEWAADQPNGDLPDLSEGLDPTPTDQPSGDLLRPTAGGQKNPAPTSPTNAPAVVTDLETGEAIPIADLPPLCPTCHAPMQWASTPQITDPDPLSNALQRLVALSDQLSDAKKEGGQA